MQKKRLFFVVVLLLVVMLIPRLDSVQADDVAKTPAPSQTEQPVLEKAPQSDQKFQVVTSLEKERAKVFLIDSTTKTKRLLIDETADKLILPVFDRFIALSPDQQYLTYVTANGLGMSNAQIWLVDTFSGEQSILTQFDTGFWIAPLVWSPDSGQIAFSQLNEEKQIEIWSINVKTQRPQLLTKDPLITSDLFIGVSLPVIAWTENGIRINDYVSIPDVVQQLSFNLENDLVLIENRPMLAAEASAIEEPLASLPCGVSQFSQNDPQWSGDIMWSCGTSIGNEGCALTSTAMVFRYYGVETSPKTLNTCMGSYACPMGWPVAANNCDSGKVNWNGSVGFSWNSLESELNSSRPPILALASGSNTHFVVVISGSGSTYGGYTINDPWDGNIKSLNSYSGWSITGMRLFSGTPWCQGSGGGCSAPNLIEPSDNSVHTSNTITFRWNTVSGCTFNGYTFRICTSSNMDNLSSCFIDTGEGGTQRTETITGHDNQDLYWGVKAANAPNGASWAVRKFRIEPGSSSGEFHLHDGTNYSGDYVRVDTAGLYTVANTFNDRAESVEIPNGWAVRLFEHDNYYGPELCLTNSDPNLWDNYYSGGGVAANSVTWFEVYSQSSCPSIVQAPGSPTLSSPANGIEMLSNTNITLDWNTSGNATEYNAHLWGGPSIDIYSGWTTTTDWFIGTLWPGNYQWQVKARNASGESAWSSTWSFTITDYTHSVRLLDVFTADDTWNPKSSFSPGETIRYVLHIQNLDVVSHDVNAVFDARGVLNDSIAYLDTTLTIDPGTVYWAIRTTAPSNQGGTHTFTGTVNFQNFITQDSASYYLSGSVPTGVCTPFKTLSCGSTVTGNNSGPGSTAVVSHYGCSDWNEWGPEYTYAFQTDSMKDITFKLSNMSTDLDIFLLNNINGECNQSNCLLSGNSEIQFTADPSKTYFLVVDGYQGAISDYTLTVSCGNNVFIPFIRR